MNGGVVDSPTAIDQPIADMVAMLKQLMMEDIDLDGDSGLWEVLSQVDSKLNECRENDAFRNSFNNLGLRCDIDQVFDYSIEFVMNAMLDDAEFNRFQTIWQDVIGGCVPEDSPSDDLSESSELLLDAPVASPVESKLQEGNNVTEITAEIQGRTEELLRDKVNHAREVAESLLKEAVFTAGHVLEAVIQQATQQADEMRTIAQLKETAQKFEEDAKHNVARLLEETQQRCVVIETEAGERAKQIVVSAIRRARENEQQVQQQIVQLGQGDETVEASPAVAADMDTKAEQLSPKVAAVRQFGATFKTLKELLPTKELLAILDRFQTALGVQSKKYATAEDESDNAPPPQTCSPDIMMSATIEQTSPIGTGIPPHLLALFASASGLIANIDTITDTKIHIMIDKTAIFADLSKTLSFVTREEEANRVMTMFLCQYIRKITAIDVVSASASASVVKILRRSLDQAQIPRSLNIANRAMKANLDLWYLPTGLEPKRTLQLPRILLLRSDFLRFNAATPFIQYWLRYEPVPALITLMGVQRTATAFGKFLIDEEIEERSLFLLSLYRRSPNSIVDWDTLAGDGIVHKFIEQVSQKLLCNQKTLDLIKSEIINNTKEMGVHTSESLELQIQLILETISLSSTDWEKTIDAIYEIAILCLKNGVRDLCITKSDDKKRVNRIRFINDHLGFLNSLNRIPAGEAKSGISGYLKTSLEEEEVDKIVAILLRLPERLQEICLVNLLYRGVVRWNVLESLIPLHPDMTEMALLAQILLAWFRWEVVSFYLRSQGMYADKQLTNDEDANRTTSEEIRSCLTLLGVDKLTDNDGEQNPVECILSGISLLDKLGKRLKLLKSYPPDSGGIRGILSLIDGTVNNTRVKKKKIQSEINECMEKLNMLGFDREARLMLQHHMGSVV